MSETKHTPGPWCVDDAERGGDAYVLGREGGDPVDVATVTNRGDDDQCVANANLIAAAPDLLAELEAIHDVDHAMHRRETCRACACIRKARGEL